MSSPNRRPSGRALSVAASLLTALSLAPLGFAQDGGRPDQVFRMRRGEVSKVIGTVTENSLETVRLDRDGKESTYDSGEVVRIQWGQVPPSFQDGTTYLSRADYENAVAHFRRAAEDPSGRSVVQADARLKAAEALLAWAAVDAHRYSEAANEADRFLADHPSNRSVPQAQWIKGRAQWLGGDAGAAATFKALYEQGASDPPSPGYDRALCLEAGLAAARTALLTKDTVNAKALFSALESAFREMAAGTVDDAALLKRLLAGRGEAAVGDGWCMLADGRASAAQRFFESLVDREELGTAGRYSARLGLAEALLADGKAREAQFQFAKVSSLDYSSRDRVAQALVGMASCGLKLKDADGLAAARTALERVRDQFGDTPAASRAISILSGL
ncbi:MAG: hypothetical protein O2816_06740 [Planctomycetota bacterium]|nr:hypothetical protein [Planctomycetota bacterium]